MQIEPLNFLYIVLAIAVIILMVLLAINLIYLIPIVRDASKMTRLLRHTTDAANKFVMKPISLATSIFDKIAPMIEKAIEARHKEAQKKSKK